MLAINTAGLLVEFYCGECYDDSDTEAGTRVIPFHEFENDGPPECEYCNNTMEADMILVPPTNAPDQNHI